MRRRSTWIVLGAFIGSLLVSMPALAHSQAEQDAWFEEWLQRAAMEPALTRELVAEYIEFTHRHEPVILPVEYRVSPQPGPGVEQWRTLVGQFFKPEDVDLALRVMWCESRGDPSAKNPVSTASGLFQHLRGWWGGEWGYPAFDPFDPVQSTQAAAWLVYDGGGWSHWNASRGCW